MQPLIIILPSDIQHLDIYFWTVKVKLDYDWSVSNELWAFVKRNIICSLFHLQFFRLCGRKGMEEFLRV